LGSPAARARAVPLSCASASPCACELNEPSVVSLSPSQRRSQAPARGGPLGPLGSFNSHHRRTPERILQKGRASFRITSDPPVQKDRGRNRLKGILIGHVTAYRCRFLVSPHTGSSRLKAHGIPSLSSQELQPRIPQMSNQTHAEVSPNVRKSASERVREVDV
jgi:hypothetical protein